MLESKRGFFNFSGNKLSEFCKIEYKSQSHTFDCAVLAAYMNVNKYGFIKTDEYIRIDQSRRSVFFVLTQDFNLASVGNYKAAVFSSEFPIFKKKNKEVCYNLADLFGERTSAIKRGIKFVDRPEVAICDYQTPDTTLEQIYQGWKQTKESDGKTFLISFNPARYYRSYFLKDAGFNIYQKLITIRGLPYAVINFSLQGDRAFELSFLSLFKNSELKIINDQNDCIIIHCLYDLYKNYGITIVNLGTSAGIKGLSFFKRKLPSFDQIVYQQ